MTQFSDRVERQRLLLAAEEWATGVSGIHVHSISSMWYDDRPDDTANGKGVTDVSYNNGLIKRSQEGNHIHTFGVELKGDALLDAYCQKVQPDIMS